MKVFISWSGARSKAVAELLRDWIKCVLQATRPWISTRDIGRGALWFTEINAQLSDTKVGLVVLTQENRNNPWILFEAGGLAKGLPSNRVCTVLVDLKPADIEDPLAQFNHTFLSDKESMWQLVRTLNASLEANGLDERILQEVFGTYWEQFEKKLQRVIKEHPATEKAEPRPKEAILEEILENSRNLNSRLQRVERALRKEDDASPDSLRLRSLVHSLHEQGRTPPEILGRIPGYPSQEIIDEMLRLRIIDPPLEDRKR